MAKRLRAQLVLSSGPIRGRHVGRGTLGPCPARHIARFAARACARTECIRGHLSGHPCSWASRDVPRGARQHNSFHLVWSSASRSRDWPHEVTACGSAAMAPTRIGRPYLVQPVSLARAGCSLVERARRDALRATRVSVQHSPRGQHFTLALRGVIPSRRTAVHGAAAPLPASAGNDPGAGSCRRRVTTSDWPQGLARLNPSVLRWSAPRGSRRRSCPGSDRRGLCRTCARRASQSS